MEMYIYSDVQGHERMYRVEASRFRIHGLGSRISPHQISPGPSRYTFYSQASPASCRTAAAACASVTLR